MVVCLDAVSKRYDAKLALDGISLDIRPGEILALLGPNGAGKTTMVRLLLGLSAPSAGTITVFGGDPRRRSSRERVGAMLQIGNASVPPRLTVREHVNLFRSCYRRPLAEGAVMEAAGLNDLAGIRFGRLSAGQKQRVLFGLALCGDPDLLFLDEPTVGLDIESRHNLWQRIRCVADGGKTVLLTTHYLEEADHLAGRIVVLQRGRIIADGAPADIKSSAGGCAIRCRTVLPQSIIGSLPGVGTVRLDGQITTVLTLDPDRVVRELLERDPRMSDLEVGALPLEEAFLALTAERAPMKG